MRSILLQWTGLSVLGSLVLTGCGSTELGKNVHLVVDPALQSAAVEFTMGDGIEISLNGEYPFADGKGKVYFVPATRDTEARAGVSVDINQLIGDELGGVGSVETLPNGAALPVAMVPPLFSAKVYEDKNFNVNALFALLPDLQLAATVGIAKMTSKHFPAGVVICQNFRDKKKVAYAAMCLYGPGTDVPGGVFLGANFGDVIKLPGTTDPIAEVSRFAMSAESAPFSMPASQLTIKAMNVKSKDWDAKIHDPKKKLEGENGAKALRNAEKILKARAK